MADYFTHFSCLFDVGTAANAARAIEIYETAVLDGDPDHPLSDGFSASIDDEAGGTTLWISGYASGDPECVIAFVLLCVGFSIAAPAAGRSRHPTARRSSRSSGSTACRQAEGARRRSYSHFLRGIEQWMEIQLHR